MFNLKARPIIRDWGCFMIKPVISLGVFCFNLITDSVEVTGNVKRETTLNKRSQPNWIYVQRPTSPHYNSPKYQYFNCCSLTLHHIRSYELSSLQITTNQHLDKLYYPDQCAMIITHEKCA